MSLLQRFPNSEIHPLFQLFDDYTTQSQSSKPFSAAVRAFSPKFDVREQSDSYELQGELPGIEQKDIHISFSDPHTLVIKGRVERDYSSEGSHEPQGRVTGEVTDSSHKASVEDDPEEPAGDAAKKQNGGDTGGKKNDEVAKKSGQQGKQQKTKYWVSERSVGEFHRAFTFPSLVNQDAVKANLKSGILSVVIPKASHHEAKRIQIE